VLDQADYLAAQMAARGMPLKGVVMNRVHPLFANASGEDTVEVVEPLIAARVRAALGDGSGTAAAARGGKRRAPHADEPLERRLAENFVAYQARARGDALRMEIFRQGIPRGVPIVQVPNLPSDIHDLGGLSHLHPHLFGAAKNDAPRA
jgi:hypothetical protein